MDRLAACRALENKPLLAETEALAANNRYCEADLIAHIAVVEERGLAEAQGYRSTYHYCVEKLKVGDAVAYWRIQTARHSRDYPRLLELIETGDLNVTTAKLIGPFLSAEKAEEIMDAAVGKSRKDVEAYIASLAPSGPRRDVVVKCGPLVMAKAQWPEPAATAPGADGAAGGPGAPTGAAGSGGSDEQRALDIVEAIDAERRRLHFDVGPDTAQLLERARDILRHKYPFASLEDIVREALNVLLDSKDLDRAVAGSEERDSAAAAAAAERPASDGRRIPMWVRRAVWRRDQGRCVFVGEEGKVCGERAWLEFDHVVPFAQGGRSDDPANVRLLCRAHNRTAADRAFGTA